MQRALTPETFRKFYRDFAEQNPKWNEIPSSTGDIYQWDEKSDYIHDPPFFENFSMELGHIEEIRGARVLVANVRIKNLMVPGTEGGVTKYFGPSRTGGSKNGDGEQMSIFDAAMKYAEAKTPLVILAGHEYGTGSSRDWAAKGTRLLGVKAVIAASFERIHRSNLVGMGVLPLQFLDGTNAQSLGLDGSEKFSITGLSDSIKPGQQVTLEIEKNGEKRSVPVKLRIDTPIEIDYYRHGGILPFVLRQLLSK
jgi:aconitate hydratase